MLGTRKDDSRRLFCLIKGEFIVFSVTVGRDCVVSDLKEVIKKERELSILKNIDPHTLELWKVNIDLKSHDESSLSHSLSHFKLEQNGEELAPWKLVGEYWSDQPPLKYLHIIVKLQPTPADMALSLLLQDLKL